MDRAPSQNAPLAPMQVGQAELRVGVVLCQAVAIWLTWNLWSVRTGGGDAPNLPVLDFPWFSGLQVGFGWLLLASLATVVLWPRIGVWAHCVLLAAAIGFDQMRIQPEFVSVAILLVGTLPGRGPQQVVRCHLISLWFWAGVHKLLSPAYLFESGPQLWIDTVGHVSHAQAVGLAIGMGAFELALGVLAAIPKARRAIPWLAGVLHGGILLSLIIQQWNAAVWPWNIALILGAAGFFGRKSECDDVAASEPAPSAHRAAHRAWVAASLFLLVHPALYYIGLADAYVSWCVYASNTPAAVHFPAAELGTQNLPEEAASLDSAALDVALRSATGQEIQFRHYASLNVPFSPAQRLFTQYFRKVAEPGDVLVIEDPRLITHWRNGGRRVLMMGKAGVIELR